MSGVDVVFLALTAGLMGIIGIALIVRSRAMVDRLAQQRAEKEQAPPSAATVWIYRVIGVIAIGIAVGTAVRFLT